MPTPPEGGQSFGGADIVFSARVVTRFALPGGFGVLVGAACATVYGWVWHQSAAAAVAAAQTDPIATVGGIAIFGFAVSEVVYQQLERPCVHCGVTIRLPRWAPARWRRRCRRHELALTTFYATDLGGAVLSRLLDLPLVAQALAHAHDIDPRQLAVGRPSPGATGAERDAYAMRVRHNLAALHSFVRLAASTGEPEIHRNYADRTATHRAIGLSRIMLCAISAATPIDVVARHQRAFATHLTASIEASAVLTLGACIVWRLLSANRRERWMAIVDELGQDLRSWALRHPRELCELAGVTHPPASVPRADRPARSFR